MAQTQYISGNNTACFRDENGMERVILHRTCVVAFNSERIILNTGGWNTSTTRNRMNQVSNEHRLGYRVFQRDGEPFVDYRGDTLRLVDNMELRRD